MTELMQYGMSGLFIAYLVYDGQVKEKRANARLIIEDERNNKYISALEKINSQLDNLTKSSDKQEDKNDRMIEKVDNFIKSIK